jgi:hypothetical protein
VLIDRKIEASGSPRRLASSWRGSPASTVIGAAKVVIWTGDVGVRA